MLPIRDQKFFLITRLHEGMGINRGVTDGQGPQSAPRESFSRAFPIPRIIPDNYGVDFWPAERSFPPQYCPHIQSLAEAFLPSPLKGGGITLLLFLELFCIFKMLNL